MIETRVYPTLVPVFPDRCTGSERYHYTLCRNEALSIQVAYRITDGSEQAVPVFPRIHTTLPVRIYHVGCVPVLHTDFSVLTPSQPIGMYPDVLQPKTVNPPVVPFAGSERNGMIQYREEGEQTKLCAYNDSWQSLWVAINEDGQTVDPGEKTLRVEFFDENGKRVGETEVRLTVLNALLPAQTLLYTNWLHCDCLADRYGVEIFSPRFYEILRDYLIKAVRNGMNMVLLPAFTPPLDTPVGEERATAQLVGVTLENRRFRFDFTRMKEFLDVCREAGIGWFEHSHFFTQWGAKHAPKIMGNDNGIYRRLFGWETDATGGEYTAFLRAYIPALKEFLKEEGLEGKVLFHISDEPKEENLEQYKLALNRVGDLLEDCMVGDAVSDVL